MAKMAHSLILASIMSLLVSNARAKGFNEFHLYFKRFIRHYHCKMPEYDKSRLENALWHGSKCNILVANRLLAMCQLESNLGRHMHTDYLGAHRTVLLRELHELGLYQGDYTDFDEETNKWVFIFQSDPFFGTFIAARYFEALTNKHSLDRATMIWNQGSISLRTSKGKKSANLYMDTIHAIELRLKELANPLITE